VKINTNIVGWLRVPPFALAQRFVPQRMANRLDRGLRILGAVLLSAVAIYFVGFGLGLYGSNCLQPIACFAFLWDSVTLW
jgi:hypothetical protein